MKVLHAGFLVVLFVHLMFYTEVTRVGWVFLRLPKFRWVSVEKRIRWIISGDITGRRVLLNPGQNTFAVFQEFVEAVEARRVSAVWTFNKCLYSLGSSAKNGGKVRFRWADWIGAGYGTGALEQQ